MKNVIRNKVTITITEQELRLVSKRSSSINHLMQTLLEDYSDYAATGNRNDRELLKLSFAVEFVKLLGSLAPKHTSAFVKIAADWLKIETLKKAFLKTLVDSGAVHQHRRPKGGGGGASYRNAPTGFVSNQRAAGYTATFVRG